MRTRSWLLLLAALAAACTRPAPPPHSPAPAGAPMAGGVTGTVAVVGSAPVSVQVVVREEGGGSVRVDGPLRDEVRRLDGARVRVYGERSGNALAATDYEVLSVDGRPVEMGVVEAAPGGGLQLRKRGGEVVRLAGATSQFRVGQKVWVQGPGTVQVQTFGVVRP